MHTVIGRLTTMTNIGIGATSPPYKLGVAGNYAIIKLNKIERLAVKLILWYFKRKGYSVTITNVHRTAILDATGNWSSNQSPSQKLYISGAGSGTMGTTPPPFEVELTSGGNVGIGT
jgi:hypothetical protein